MKKINKAMLFTMTFLTMVICLCFGAGAVSDVIVDSGECGAEGDNVTWVLYDDGELVISGEGEMADYDYDYEAPWNSEYNVKSVVVENGITSIGYLAFYHCESLVSATISKSVTSIGLNAFYECESIEKIMVDEDNEYYSSDEGVLLNKNKTQIILYPLKKTEASYVIPSGVIDIDDEVFDNNNLKSITIPKSVTSIADGAFDACEKLEKIIVDKDNKHYSSDNKGVLFNKNKTKIIQYPVGRTEISYVIPSSVTCIDYVDFANIYLKSITIPNSVTSIESGAFFACKSLERITVDENNKYYSSDDNGVLFNENKTSIIQYPVGKAESSYTIPNGVSSIGDRSFAGCINLVKIIIINGVTRVESNAFYNCICLANITLPDSVASIGENAFCSTAYYNDLENWENEVLYIGKHLIEANDYISGVYNIKNGTLNIADGAFYDCANLTEITIPNSVKSMGYGTFVDCDSLKNVEIGNGITKINDGVFYNCCSLTSLRIPNGVTAIGDYTFYNCENLTIIILSETVKTIGVEAFSGCISLASLDIPKSVTSIGDKAFYGCENLVSITISDAVTNIGAETFYNCKSLEAIKIPKSVTNIGDKAFYACEKLGSVTMYDNVTSIGAEVFFNCINLETIKLSDNIITIGDRAFYLCEKLTSITISDTVTTIGAEAFNFCNSLINITVDPDNKCYSSDNQGVLFNKDKTKIIQYPASSTGTSYVIPDGVICIETRAFYSCENLTSIKIPASVTSMGDRAFSSNQKLLNIVVDTNNEYFSSDNYGALFDKDKTVFIQYPIGCAEKSYTIPDGVTTIRDFAFSYNVSLERVIIPDSVTAIGFSFNNTKLSDIDFKGTEDNWKKITLLIPNNPIIENMLGGNTIGDLNNKEIFKLFFCDAKINYNVASCNHIDSDGDGYCDNGCGSKVEIDTGCLKNEHEFAEMEIVVEPSCTRNGSGVYHCINCEYVSQTYEVPALGHTEVILSASEASCDQMGFSEGKYCSVCNVVLLEQEVTMPFGHKYEEERIKATTKKDGFTRTYCTVCDTELSSNVVEKIATVKLSASKVTYNGKVITPSVTVKDTVGKVLEKGIDYTVKYASGRKAVGKYAVKITFKGEYEGSKTLYFSILPSTTKKVSASQTSDTVTLKWSKVTGATGYRVYVYNNKTAKWTTVANTTKTTYTVKKLKAGTEYKYAVKAYAKSGEKTLWADDFATIITATKPDTATLKATAGKKSATLKWSKEPGTGYVVYMATSKDGKYSKVATVKGSANTSFVKKNLTTGKTYYFKVRAYKTVGDTNLYGAYSAVKAVKVK